jgi:hypothetical protein
MTVRAQLMGGSFLGRWIMRIGMRDRAHLRNEKCQRNKGCDAKLVAMRLFEQGRPNDGTPES